jgi:plastocyanin
MRPLDSIELAPAKDAVARGGLMFISRSGRSRHSALVTLGLVGVLAVFAFGSAACGDPDADDPTPVKTFKITPASGTQPANDDTPTPTGAATIVTSDTPGTGNVIQISAENIEFNTDELTAPAGEITIEFDNRDSGIVHNIHIREGTKPNGASIAKTKLETGPKVQTLTVTLEAGEYYFLCDAHPNMNGILTVQ